MDIGKFKYDVTLISETKTPDEYGGYTTTKQEVSKPCYIEKIETREVYDETQQRFLHVKRAIIYIRNEGETFDKFTFDDEVIFRVVNITPYNRTILKVEGVSYAT
jgi:hypothetical protein